MVSLQYWTVCHTDTSLVGSKLLYHIIATSFLRNIPVRRWASKDDSVCTVMQLMGAWMHKRNRLLAELLPDPQMGLTALSTDSPVWSGQGIHAGEETQREGRDRKKESEWGEGKDWEGEKDKVYYTISSFLPLLAMVVCCTAGCQTTFYASGNVISLHWSTAEDDRTNWVKNTRRVKTRHRRRYRMMTCNI